MRQFIKTTLLLLALLLPATATAHDFEVDGIYYNIFMGNSAQVTYKGTYGTEYSNEYSGDLTIPATVTYNSTTYPVTSIGNSAFMGCTGLTSIDIPNSVGSIWPYAFSRCSGLTSVTIPNSVTSIGKEAFYVCNSLTSVTIPNSVISIGNKAFWGCHGLTSISIPNSVTSIGDCVFSNCSGLTSIQVDNSNPTYDSRNKCNAIIETSTNTLIAGCMNTIIPNSVTTIEEYTFYGCSGLTSISIPNSVTEIGEKALSYCRGLTSIQVENGNPTYDSRKNCNAIIETSTNSLITGCMNTTIPNSITAIDYAAFFCCTGLTSITIPNSVTSIGNEAFCGCSGLTCVTIPNSVTSIGSYAFNGCSELTTVFLTGDGEWTAGALPNTAALYVNNGITGVKGMNVKPSDVFSFAMTPPTCDENSFTDYSGTLHVPRASLGAYFTAPYWCNFANIVGDAVKPNGISLDKESIELFLSETTALETAISPATATSNIINWASSNPAVATVVDGQVTAVSHGECDIVALCADQRAVCHVTVYSDRISLDEQAQVLPNHMMILSPTSLAATLPALTVTSSDPTVAAARVMNGKVQIVGVSEGTATITVASTDGSAKPATCLVTVYTELGDTNGDGFIDIDDVTKLIERVLGNEATDIKEKNGDMNEDGVLDIDDVTALINTILGTN